MEMYALDISNNTPKFGSTHIAQWKGAGVELAIVQLVTGVRLAGDDCATQILKCLDGGLAVDCYLFPPNDGLTLTTQQRLNLVPDQARASIRQLWCDIEKAWAGFPSRGQVDKVHSTCDLWAPWQKCGDYSALWVAQATGWIPWLWPTRKQWLVYVLNSGASNFGGTFKGTNNHVMTQCKMDVVMAGIGGMDLSLLSVDEEAAVTDWLGGSMTLRLGQGLNDKLTAEGDQALMDHAFYQQQDDDGNWYDCEKVRGVKGMYYASNVSGQWVVSEPQG